MHHACIMHASCWDEVRHKMAFPSHGKCHFMAKTIETYKNGTSAKVCHFDILVYKRYTRITLTNAIMR